MGYRRFAPARRGQWPRALSGTLDAAGLQRARYADNWWSRAALLGPITGPLSAFGALEKSTENYLTNRPFVVKMRLFLLILALEIYPRVTFIRAAGARCGTQVWDTERKRPSGLPGLFLQQRFLEDSQRTPLTAQSPASAPPLR